MAAIPLHLLLQKGTDFDATFNIQNEDSTTPLNLTGYTADAKMRRSYYSTTSTDFLVEFVDRYNGILKISFSQPVIVVIAKRSPVVFFPGVPFGKPSSNFKRTLCPGLGE